MNQPSFRDIEQLSAYLDGQLSQADAARLESRIQSDPELRSVYDDLRQSQALLRKLPARRAPRNFRLTPKMAGVKPPLPRAFPVFRLASVLAAILFFIGYAANLSVPAAASIRAFSPDSYGLSGGAPAAVQLAPAAIATAAPAATESAAEPKFSPTHEPLLAAQDNLAPTPTPIESGQANLRQAETTTSPDMMTPSSYQAPPTAPQRLPVHPAWLLGLLGLAVLSGATAFIVRAKTERNWSKANAFKPAGLRTKDIFLFTLVIVAVLLLTASIYWMSTATF